MPFYLIIMDQVNRARNYHTIRKSNIQNYGKHELKDPLKQDKHNHVWYGDFTQFHLGSLSVYM